VLLGLLDAALGKGHAVHGLRVPGIGLGRLAQVVESRRLSPSWPRMAPKFLRAMGLLGSVARACMMNFLACSFIYFKP
jgi:hypothetical protein